jgi:twitching motility protein PilJ
MRMASTPNKKSAPSVGKSNKSSNRSQPPQSKSPDKKKPQGSMGLGLLMIAIGTSLVGLGGLGYLFYQELLSSSQREVDRASEAQTRQIEGKFANVRQSAESVASTAKALALQAPKPKTAEPYQKLVLDSLQNSEAIAGMGIVQNENRLFVSPKPVSPYVWTEQSGLKPEVAGQKLPAPNDKLFVASRPDISANPFYKAAIAKGKASWSDPYNASGKSVITYFAPIGDSAKPMGMVQADTIASNILAIATTTSNAESKVGFVVVSSSGKVITASDTFASSQAQNPAITESLNTLVQQSKAKPTGITQTGGNLWAYRKIQGSDLVVATYLPESEITSKLMVLVGGAALGISAILAIAILSFVSSLKKRLQPLTQECDRFLTEQGTKTSEIGGKDEIEHLSLSLKNTFQKVKTNEFRLRNELAQNPSESAAQVQESAAETDLMEAEVGDLLDVVSSMEEGDLTIEAQVNDRATGLVADTLNRLREKLIEIISSVLGTAQQVAQGASDLEELARTVVLNTAEQAESVAQGQALTEQVAAIATRSSEQVNIANQSLQEVRDTVSSGQTAINTLTDSIVVLQTGSAQIVQRMKTLGEFVGLAEQFVQDQGQIASLTQVLALNATLVAARAAEQKDPKQFAGVAREFEAIAVQVNDLATQTNEGLTTLQQRTSQIQSVVTAIDVEVQNLSGLVAGFTTGVDNSQSAFNSIQIATEEVVQIGLTITKSSTEIADAAGSTASYISEIAQLADRTANLTRSARQQAEAMGYQAQQLLQGIQFFRLPETSAPVYNAPAYAESAYTESAYTESNSSVNSFVDYASPEHNLETNLEPDSDSMLDSNEEQGNGGLGLVVPVIGLAAATFAISQSGQSNASEFADTDIDLGAVQDQDFILDSDNLFPDRLISDNLVPDSLISDNLVPDDLIPDDLVPDNLVPDDLVPDNLVPDDLAPDDFVLDDLAPDSLVPDNLISEDESTSIFLDTSHDEPLESDYSSLTDISTIEESLFADLKHETYSHETYAEDVFEQNSVNYAEYPNYVEDAEQPLTVDDETTLKNPMDGVDEFAVNEAVSDPIVSSATSSFLEDTTFGNPSSLSEEVLSNLPTSFDFSVPDLDYIDYNDDTFEPTTTTLESPLDEINSFFEADLDLDQQVGEPDLGFDVFNPVQPETVSGEYTESYTGEYSDGYAGEYTDGYADEYSDVYSEVQNVSNSLDSTPSLDLESGDLAYDYLADQDNFYEQPINNDYALDEVAQADVEFDDPFENLDLSQTVYATGLSGFGNSTPNLAESNGAVEPDEVSQESEAIAEVETVLGVSELGVSELLELPIDSSEIFSFDVEEDLLNLSPVLNETDNFTDDFTGNFFDTELMDADSAQGFNEEISGDISEDIPAIANPLLNPLDEIYDDEVPEKETSFPSLFEAVNFDEDESLDEYDDDFSWQSETVNDDLNDDLNADLNTDLNADLNVDLNADLIPSIDLYDGHQDTPEVETLDFELPDFTAIADSDELELAGSPELPSDVNLPVGLDDAADIADSGLDEEPLSEEPLSEAAFNETLNNAFMEPEYNFDLLEDEDSSEFDAFQQPVEEISFDPFDSLLSDDEGFSEPDPFSQISVIATDDSVLNTEGFTEPFTEGFTEPFTEGFTKPFTEAIAPDFVSDIQTNIAPDVAPDITPDIVSNIASAIESVSFGEIWESSSIDQNDDLSYQELAIFGVVSNDLEDSVVSATPPETPQGFIDDDSAIFESLASDLDDYSLENYDSNYDLDDSGVDLDLSAYSSEVALDSDIAPHIDNSPDNPQMESEFIEDSPDFSIDLSEDWLNGIVDEETDNEDDFSAIAESVSDIPPDSSYGFADDLLNSLMDESDEDNLSMDLPAIDMDSSWLPDHVQPEVAATEIDNIDNVLPTAKENLAKENQVKDEAVADPKKEQDQETDESKFDFDFSAFNAPISSLGALAKEPVVKAKTARDEIEDFLSGNFDIDQPV